MVMAVGPIGRDAAQRLARQELAKAIYHPRRSFFTWLHEQLDKLFSKTQGAVPGGWWAVVALAALVVIIVAVVVGRVGPVARTRRQAGSGPLRDTRPLTARAHRELARQFAAVDDFSGAILEYVRAIAASLEERALLPPGPGRTADELAVQAGRLFPRQAADLTDAASLFDEIRYGGRSGGLDGYQRVRDLETAIREATPETEPAAPVTAGALP